MKNKTISILFIALFLIPCVSLSVGTCVFGSAQAAANERLAESPAITTQEGDWNTNYLADL